MRRFGNTDLLRRSRASGTAARRRRRARAKIFINAIDDVESSLRTVRVVRRLYPDLKVFARAHDRRHAWQLMDLGVEVFRETFASGLEMGREVLVALGVPREAAEERTQRFREHDEHLLATQHLIYDDESALLESAQAQPRGTRAVVRGRHRPHAGHAAARRTHARRLARYGLPTHVDMRRVAASRAALSKARDDERPARPATVAAGRATLPRPVWGDRAGVARMDRSQPPIPRLPVRPCVGHGIFFAHLEQPHERNIELGHPRIGRRGVFPAGQCQRLRTSHAHLGVRRRR